jgi:hypothetical protein
LILRDLQLILATDDLDEAVRLVERHAIEHFGLRARRPPKPLPWLGEPTAMAVPTVTSTPSS